jgi:hypothetical protein
MKGTRLRRIGRAMSTIALVAIGETRDVLPVETCIGRRASIATRVRAGRL